LSQPFCGWSSKFGATATSSSMTAQPSRSPSTSAQKSDKGGYTSTADKGTAVFPEVVPDTYTISSSWPTTAITSPRGPPRRAGAEAADRHRRAGDPQEAVGGVEGGQPRRRNKDVTNVKFQVAIPPKIEGNPPEVVEKRPAGEHNVAKVEKLRGEHVELQQVETDHVLIFESVESA